MDIPSKQRQIERWSKLTQPDISELECLACKKQFEINKNSQSILQMICFMQVF